MIALPLHSSLSGINNSLQHAEALQKEREKYDRGGGEGERGKRRRKVDMSLILSVIRFLPNGPKLAEPRLLSAPTTHTPLLLLLLFSFHTYIGLLRTYTELFLFHISFDDLGKFPGHTDVTEAGTELNVVFRCRVLFQSSSNVTVVQSMFSDPFWGPPFSVRFSHHCQNKTKHKVRDRARTSLVITLNRPLAQSLALIVRNRYGRFCR